jgi:YfiH family protein
MTMFVERGGFVCCEALERIEGVQHGFGSRAGGSPAELAPEQLFRVRQVHGNRVVEVVAGAQPQQLASVEADAIITMQPVGAIAIATADCVPLLLADQRGRAVGAAHAGWRGIVAGVVQATVERMVGCGCEVGSIVAAVGPAIGVEAYEVGEETAERFAEMVGVVRWPARPVDKPRVDLKRAVAQLLARRGVEQVFVSPQCTATDAARFHSSRRDGAAAGRQLSIIGLR